MRAPKFGFEYDPFELPLHYGNNICLENQWTLVLCHDNKDHSLLGATLYNGDSQRAAYYHEKQFEWNLTEFSFLEGEAPVPGKVLMLAREYITNILGIHFTVYNTSALNKDNDESYS